MRSQLAVTSRDGNVTMSHHYSQSGGRPSAAVFTVVGSTRGVAGCLAIQGEGELPKALVKLQNSVFENDGAEVTINGGNVFAIRNRYDSLAVTSGALVQNDDNLSAPPELQSSGVPLNTSPLVNAGSRFVDGGLPPSTWLATRAGHAPYRGAFEAAVNNIAVLGDTPSRADRSLRSGGERQSFNGASRSRQHQGPCPRVITLTNRLNVPTRLASRAPRSRHGAQQSGLRRLQLCAMHRAERGALCLRRDHFDSAEAIAYLEGERGFSGFSGVSSHLSVSGIGWRGRSVAWSAVALAV